MEKFTTRAFTFCKQDLSYANLSSAKLFDADLTGAIGLKCAQLAAATDWELAFRDSEFTCGELIPGLSAERN